jgi:hypothetical protein
MNVVAISNVTTIPVQNPNVTAAAKSRTHLASLPHIAAEIKEQLAEMWLPRIYSERILPLRTRAYHLELSSKHASVDVQHTLLGVELKIGRRRIMCPDLATARYLASFARLGVVSFAIPYDITQISRLANDLEFAWQRLLLLINHIAQARSVVFRTRLRAALTTEARNEISISGAGADRPQFDRETKQRRG